MIVPRTLKCMTCGHQTTTRTAIGHGDYQEFAFPCPGCGLEMRYGMKLLLNKRIARIPRTLSQGELKRAFKALATKENIKYTNLRNAKVCAKTGRGGDVLSFDGESLIPISGEHFSPFMATALLPINPQEFQHHQYVRYLAVQKFWPEISRLLTHLERKQWSLFDKQFKELDLDLPLGNGADRVKAIFTVMESYGRFFCRDADGIRQRIRQRIALSKSTSTALTHKLINYFRINQKDASIKQELTSIRDRWSHSYTCLAPVFMCFYWDDKKHTLDSYALAQKRFNELKPLYVDCFETFCRISVIAAGLEGIIHKNSVGIPVSNRVMPLAEFEGTSNGAKLDILRHLVIGDMFVPYIDHNLRNGIGHHSAHYDVTKDSIAYMTQNRRSLRHFHISYIRFCEKVVRLYGQLEALSIYSHWVRQAALGVL